MNQSHSKPLLEIFREISSSPEGLTGAEAANRLVSFGYNRLEVQKRISPWMLLLEQFKNVLIITLLIATGISAYLGHGVEAVAISVIVLFAVISALFRNTGRKKP
jgi:Ca2+-transporting ATPase